MLSKSYTSRGDLLKLKVTSDGAVILLDFYWFGAFKELTYMSGDLTGIAEYWVYKGCWDSYKIQHQGTHSRLFG